MNVLKRKMFANGDIVQNAPLVDVTAQIANYSVNGLSPIEIFELLQRDYARRGMEMPRELGMLTIERIARKVGGPMKEDADIDSVNLPELGGTGGLEEGPYSTVPTIADPRLPPADITLENRLGTYIQRGQSLNPAERPVDLSVDLDALMQGVTTDDDLPKIQNQELGPNDIRLSTGEIKDWSQGIEDIKKGKGVGLWNYRIWNSDLEKGANVQAALKQFVKEDEPGAFKWLGGLLGGTLEERRGGQFSSEDFGSALSSGLKGAVDVGREGLERTIPGITEFFLGKKAAEVPKSFLEGEFDEGYLARGGFSPETIDNIVVDSALGIDETRERFQKSLLGKRSKPIDEDLADLLTPTLDVAPEETLSPLVAIKDIVPGETIEESEEYGSLADKIIAEVSTDEELVSTDKKEPVFTGEKPVSTDEEPVSFSRESTPETNFAQFTRSPDFIRFIRNLGKGMVSTGEMGKGIALGSAAAAEEKYVDEKEAKLLAAELAKEKSKLKSKYDDPVYLKMIRDSKLNVSTQYRTYQEAESTRALTASVIQYLDDGNITDLAARFGVGVDKVLTLMGLGPENIEDQSPRERAQNALTILKQKNIKAILNESSRTISNVDREIADKIAGSLETFDITSEGGLKQKLNESLRSAIETKNESVRKARAEYGLLSESGEHLTLDENVINFVEGKLSSIEQNKNKGFGYDPSITFIDAVTPK